MLNKQLQIYLYLKIYALLEFKDLDLIFGREGLAGLDIWSILVVQSEQNVIYRLM